MIRLTLMKEWFDRVDVERRSSIANLIASPWFGSDADVLCGRASSNFVCRVTAGGRTYFLRCNHESERTAEYYAAEMAFVEHLAASGVPVARPIPSKAGALVESVPTEMGTYHAVLLEGVDGEERESADMDEESLAGWGQTMARLHAASEGYVARGRPDWREHLAFARNEIPANEEAAHRELASIGDIFQKLKVDSTNSGTIHFDMEADNLRWKNGEPAVFDFDDCARYPFAADVAYALRGLYEDCIGKLDVADWRLHAFVSGYRRERPLSDSELQLFPLFVRAHNLFWFARIHRSVADGVVPREKEWTTSLRAHLVSIMSRYRNDFEKHPVGQYLN
ncbi:MAG: hypothetical protein NVSMB52_16560 [Chloroflexota bacterium]